MEKIQISIYPNTDIFSLSKFVMRIMLTDTATVSEVTSKHQFNIQHLHTVQIWTIRV